MQRSALSHEADLDLAGLLIRSRVRAALLGESPEPVRIGRFEVLRCLGQGGYGAVYEAREDGSAAALALKCLHVAGAAQRSALQREFRAAQRLVHPHLVTLYELFTCDARPFFTMELVRGQGLLAELASQRASHEAICRSFDALLDALVTIHAAGKVHRDLKPSNVLLGEDGRLVVLDYGLMIDGELGSSGFSAGGSGTRSYMAPEQKCGAGVGAKVDVYAVGKMLTEALRAARGRASSPLSPMLQALSVHMQDPDPLRRPDAEQALSCLRKTTRQHGGGHLRPRSVQEPFVGRAAELCTLHRALSRARSGTPGMVWVEGESGMGKSALLREFATQASEAGALVLEGRCYERENSPFKVFDGVISCLARCLRSDPEGARAALAPEARHALSRLFPELARALLLATDAAPSSDDEAPTDPSASMLRAFAALHRVFAQLGTRQPVLIAVDDLQWGDADSARLMLGLLEPALPTGVLFVGAYRASEGQSSPFLRRVLEPTRAQLGELALDPLVLVGLTDPEVGVLADALGHAATARSDRVLRVLRTARGMPFLLSELLSAPGFGNERESSLEQRLIERVHACSARAQRLLDTLCIAGRPLLPAVAAHAAELDAGIWPSANELCAQRLARWRESDEGRELEPYHDIVRSLIAERARGPERVAAHRRLAQAVDLHAEHDAELSLTHWLCAGDRLEARRCALRAVERARAAMAWSRAAELYQLVLELSAAGDRGHAQLHEARGEMLAFAGEHAASGAAYELAASQAPAARAEALYRRAATQLLLGGRVERGVSLTTRALASVGIAYPDSAGAAHRMWLRGRLQLGMRRALTRLLGPSALPVHADPARCEALRAAYRGLTVHDPVRGAALHARYLCEAHGRADAHELEALVWEATELVIVSGPNARRAVSRIRTEAMSISRGANEPFMRAIVMLFEATYLLHCCERPRDATLWLDRAEELLKRCPGSHFERGWLRMLRDYTTLAAEEVDLRGYLLARERESVDREDAYTHKQLLLTVPLLRLMEDRPDRALAFFESRWPGQTEPNDMFAFLALSGRLDTLLYQRDAVAAHALLKASTRGLIFKLAPQSIANHLAYLRARNAVALYAQTQKPALAREVRRVARLRRSMPRLSRGLFRGLLASLAIAEGDDVQAGELLLGACHDLVSTQHYNLAWLVRYRLAQLRGNTGDFERAEAWVRARGVREPEAWVSVLLPVKPASSWMKSR